ncbi:hypothetical protein [Synechococcus sp. 8F6]|uniref:hypothetical protein n=1 Tax=Synechococcus sp. 8F6 TaxID=2025606 RepID=UPI001E6379DD|nr:hypothetical protein [Synechococcus sp. 8F6]
MPASATPFSPRARQPFYRQPVYRQPLYRLRCLQGRVAIGVGMGLVALGGALPAALWAKAPPAAPDPVLAALLRSGDLSALNGACTAALERGDGLQLRRLQQRLLTIHPAPQPLAVVLANANSLLSCGAPDGALAVLGRVSPAAGAERAQWLVLQWRAAQAGLHHQLAADALERLAAGNLASLASLELPVGQRQDGTPVTRPALDLLASHLESLGQRQRAAEVLVSSAQPGAATAVRLSQAVALLDGLPAPEQDRLLELALEQAAAAGAWGLVAQILDQQLALVSSTPESAARVRERRLRLSGGIDDAYGEWLLRRRDPAGSARQLELERQLRSPRAPGGHAAPPTPISQP